MGRLQASETYMMGDQRVHTAAKPSDWAYMDPQDRSWLQQGGRPVVWTLSRMTTAIVGREREVEAVLASLRQCGVAVIWGDPGVGKATVAMAAAAKLRDKQPTLNAFALDMRGEPWVQPSYPAVCHAVREFK